MPHSNKLSELPLGRVWEVTPKMVLTRTKKCGVCLIVAIIVAPVCLVAQSAQRDTNLSRVVLTSDLVKKLVATQAGLARVSSMRPSGTPIGADPETVVLMLEKDADVQQVLRDVGWTAAEYIITQTTIVETLMAIDALDAGQSKKLPTYVLEANVKFLSNLPDDVPEDFIQWKRTSIDPAIRELRKAREGR